MATVEVTRQRDEETLIANPWPLLVGGLVTIAVGALVSSIVKDAVPWLTVLLVSVGAVAVGGAVVVRYGSALVWGLAARAPAWEAWASRKLAGIRPSSSSSF